MNRPQLGDRIIAPDRAVKRHGMRKRENYQETYWERYGEGGFSPLPVNGIYIGFRHVKEGVTHYPASYDEYPEFTPKNVVEVWLVVENPRHNPVRVFPKDAAMQDEAIK